MRIHHLTAEGLIPDSDMLCKTLCGRIEETTASDATNLIWMATAEFTELRAKYISLIGENNVLCSVCNDRQALYILATTDLE